MQALTLKKCPILTLIIYLKFLKIEYQIQQLYNMVVKIVH